MFHHYTKIAWRNMLRDKMHFLINTLGLALSMFCAMLIILWINDELSYETFFPESEQIYRLVQDEQYDDGSIFKVAAMPGVLPEYIQDNYAGIESFTRFRPMLDKVMVEYEDHKFYESLTYADSTFFHIFQFPFIVGNRDKAMLHPNSVVITARVAEKYFGKNWREENVLGKIIFINRTEKFEVTGVIENLPSNTHFKSDMLIPFRKLYQYGWYLDWGNNYYYGYFKLKKGADPQLLSKQVSDFGKTRDDMADIWYFQKLTDIHLHSDLDIDVYGTSEPRAPYVKIFIVVAIAIILIACINFMNLSTARSEQRAKEIGLRKTVGSLRSQITMQLLGESVMVTMLALMLAAGAMVLALPSFNIMTGKVITLGLDKWPIWISFLTGAVVIGLLAGSYPALYLSAFKPVQVLKGRFRGGNSGTTFRRVLVVVQFSVTIILLLGTAIVYKQFRFFMEKDLGYNKDLLIYMPVRGDIWKNYAGFKNELLQHPSVKGVTVSSDILTYTVHSFGGFDWDGKNKEDNVLLHSFSAGYDYIETLGLQMAEGRSFSVRFPADSANYILNEAALKLTGIKSPIGARFNMWGQEGKIVGIVKDFNYKSLHQKVEPLVLRMNPAWNDYFMMRIAPGETDKTLATIEQVWKKHNPDFPFEYHFMDQEYENLYHSEKRMARIFDFFTVFTLFIACLGLIGLINHTIEKRRKEISVRKVHGATISNILVLLSREYVQLIIIAILISLPLAGFLIHQWLKNYAYQISVDWWLYAIPGVVVLLVALAFVGGQTVKAARQNPVDNLRYE
jgi:ABC-type antimicrobial peptide transport system permease subunit